MEEMFDEEMAPEVRELKYRLRAAGLATKLADGETHRRGIPPRLLAERVAGPGGSEEPLFDIDQPDMYANGFVRMTAIAQACAGLERLERPLPASWRSSKKRSEHSESRASLSERHSIWWEQVEPTWGSRSWPR